MRIVLTQIVLFTSIICARTVPDLDGPNDHGDDGAVTPTTKCNRCPSSPFEHIDDEQGVTVALLNFLMVLFGLSSMRGPSRRRAITAT